MITPRSFTRSKLLSSCLSRRFRGLAQRANHGLSSGTRSTSSKRPFSSAATTPATPAAPWISMGSFAVNENAATAWRSLRNSEQVVQDTIDNYLSRVSNGSPLPSIDWEYWDKAIKHRSIVECLKATYDAQLGQLDQVLIQELETRGANVLSDVANKTLTTTQDSWALYDAAVESCQRAVTESDVVVTDGAKALWVSYCNPPAWTISPEDWLESDKYWQAYVERHHHFDPAKDVESYSTPSFESPEQAEIQSREWRRKNDLFHDRSDTPILYSYMDQLHSQDYYDINRRKFVEHMLYFLVRTGNPRHFFPELPPPEWQRDIEIIRFCYLHRAHERRKARQLASLAREEPLDLCPKDSQWDHAEEFYLNLFSKERSMFEATAARLMSDFAFLCFPAVPCQSPSALLRARTAIGDGNGAVYSIGDDVDCLYYLPTGVPKPFESTTTQCFEPSPVSGSSPESKDVVNLLPTPTASIRLWITYLMYSGRSGYVNPGYLDAVQLHAEVLERRGRNWLLADGESLPDAFLRRLAKDDPTRPVYEQYVAELRDRWVNHAVELTNSEEIELRLKNIADNATVTAQAVYQIFR